MYRIQCNLNLDWLRIEDSSSKGSIWAIWNVCACARVFAQTKYNRLKIYAAIQMNGSHFIEMNANMHTHARKCVSHCWQHGKCKACVSGRATLILCKFNSTRTFTQAENIIRVNCVFLMPHLLFRSRFLYNFLTLALPHSVHFIKVPCGQMRQKHEKMRVTILKSGNE